MGLLSGLFDDEDGRMALGLLAAGGPTTDPNRTGLGARLNEAVGSVDQWKQQQMARQMQQMQFAQAQQKFGMVRDFMAKLQGGPSTAQPSITDSGAPAGMGQLGNGTFGMMPTGGAPDIPKLAQQQPQGNSPLANMTPDQIAMFKMATGEDLSPIWKTAKEGFERKPGSFYEDMQGRRSYIADPTKGITMDQAGNVVNMPGSLQALSALTGANKNAEIQATNDNTLAPLDRIDPGTNRPFNMTTGDLIRQVKGQQLPSGLPSPSLKPGSIPVNDPTGVIARDAAENGITDPVMNFQGKGTANITPASNMPSIMRNTGNAPQSGFNGFRGPDEALRSAAQIESEKSAQIGAQSSAQKYVDNLHDTVQNEYSLVNRNKQILPLLDQYKSGGFGAEDRLHFGNAIRNTEWLPDSVKALGDKIAGGSAVAGKVLENQIAAAAITTMLDTLNKEGKPNRAIFQALQAAQEGLNSGNTTLKDVFNLQQRLYQQHFDEQQAITKSMKDGSYDPRTWAGDYSAIRNTGLSTPAAPLPSANIPKFDARGNRVKD